MVTSRQVHVFLGFLNFDSTVEPNAFETILFSTEYAYSLKATEKSDVYSMGIVLMELVTGKMPTETMFDEETDMVRWVETVLDTPPGSKAREKLIDSELKPLLPREEDAAYQVLEIAIQCTKTYPQERPSSRQASDYLLNVFNNRAASYREVQTDTDK